MTTDVRASGPALRSGCRGEHAVSATQDRNARGVGGGPRGPARPREGAHEAGRRAGTPATRAAMGSRREGLPPRHRRRPPRASELFDGRSQLLVYHFMFGPSYQAGCPVNSSIADSIDGAHPAPEGARRDDAAGFAGPAREVAGVQAADGLGRPLGVIGQQRLQPRPRILEQRGTDAHVGRAKPSLAAADRRSNARASGTDVVGYLTESPGFTAFVMEDGVVYHSYSTGWRGLEFLMGYYPILDRAPKGRDEAEGFQLWIRRHDEYRG